MSTRNYISLLVILAICSSCAKPKVFYAPSFITAYYDVKELCVDENPCFGDLFCVAVYSYGQYLYPFDNLNGNIDSGSISFFYELSKKHNDFLPQKREVRLNSHIHQILVPPVAPAIDIKHITLKSLSDYDSQHLQGSSLDDVVRVVGTSPYKYIQSGYQDKFQYEQDSFSEFFNELYGCMLDEKSEFYPIDKLIKDVGEEELYVLCSPRSAHSHGVLFYLIFEQLPQRRPQQALLEVTTDRDEKYSLVIDIE